MIFITVGTHEQGMDRLFIEIDKLIERAQIKDKVFAQIGYTDYVPKYFEYKKMISYDEMDRYMRNSKIIITHGGPGTIFHPLQYNKIPIVVPRNPQFNEHIDDHQILFAKKLEEGKRVLAVYDINTLINSINNYDEKVSECIISRNNTQEFVERFTSAVYSIFSS